MGLAAGTLVTNYSLTVVSPLGTNTGTGVTNGAWYNNPEFILQRYNFDEVKLTGYTVRYKPVLTQLNLYDQSIAQQNIQNNANPILYSWIDRDSNTLSASSTNVTQKILQYDSCKRHMFTKPFSRRVKVNGVWLDTSSSTMTGQVSNTTTVYQTNHGLLSCLGIYGENLPWGALGGATEALGNIEVEWYFCFRGKRPVNLTLDEASGALTVLPEEKFAPIQPTTLAFANTNDVGQLVAYDVSGNPIYVTP